MVEEMKEALDKMDMDLKRYRQWLEHSPVDIQNSYDLVNKIRGLSLELRLISFLLRDQFQ